MEKKLKKRIIHIHMNHFAVHLTQINLSMKQKQTHRRREQTCGCGGGGGMEEGWIGSLGLADANYYI